ncbi:MAG: hypothetical protein GEV09_18570 [Pseudonocardiaceae bacterium]|nr:hypothetical protein [Pseudonocardiaceae bacterium]
MPLSPDADPTRRAWIGCCEEWCYLLGNEGPQVHLQCPECRKEFWHDTGFRHGQRQSERPSGS